MTLPTILVTGATGGTGSAVVSQLLEAGWPVRALVRGLDARSQRLRSAGADIVLADVTDPEQLLHALTGVQRAYYLPPFDPYMIQSATAFAVAARAARLEAIVGLSQWLASPSHPSLATRQHWLVDHLFAMVPGVAHTTVNPGYFADNYLRLLPFAAQLGLLPSLTGNSRNAPPSNEDIARVAVAALMDPAKHAGKRYRPTGPALLSERDISGIMARVLERSVAVVPMPRWLFSRAARQIGLTIDQMSGIRYYLKDHQDGAFEMGAPTDDVVTVTGRQPEDFETITRRYATYPSARRTPGNWLRLVADFIRLPVSPGYDLARYDRELRRPWPGHPQFAVESEIWRSEHQIAPGDAASPAPRVA